MILRGRTIFIALCALAGAFLSAAYFPLVLDRMFIRVLEMNRGVPATSPEVVIPDRSTNNTSRTPFDQGQRIRQRAQGDRSHGVPPDLDDSSQKPNSYEAGKRPSVIAAMALLGMIIGGAIGSILLRFFGRATVKWDKMAIGDKVTLFVGIFAGIVASSPFLFVFQGLGALAPIVTLSLTVGFSALSVYALKSMEDALPWQRSTGKRRKSGIKVLDTNILIDGRIYDLVRTGFIEGEIYVPSFVLKELQHIADSADSLRRQRGRRGLDILKRIQAETPIEVGTYDRYASDEREEVDSRLVRVAKAIGGDLVSNDFNLNRVATVQDVKVLSINDLALALRPTVLPGESLDVAVVREGSQMGQGIGYLDDGTMVVVEHGRDLIGQQSQVFVTQVIQTERGKMIFADADKSEAEEAARRPRSKR